MPQVPNVPFPTPDRAGVFGDWLYLAMPEGLFAFDTAASLGTESARPLLPGALPQWIGIDGNALSVIATVVADDPSLVEHGPVTRLYRLDLSSDAGNPNVSSSIDLPGRIEQARLEPGRLVTLSGVAAASDCSGEPRLAYPEDRHPNQMVVTELGLDGGSWAVTEQVTVESVQGFVETRDAYVLTHENYISDAPDSADLTVVEVSNGTLSRWSSVEVVGRPEPSGPMGVAAGKLAAFLYDENDDESWLELAVFSPGAVVPRLGGLRIVVFAREAHFEGSFALIPGREREATVRAGLVIDWQRDGGPVVVAEMPADLFQLHAIGERWLGIGRQRSVVFQLRSEGTIEIDAELGPPPGALDDSRSLLWDESSQKAWLSYAVAGTDAPGVNAERAIGILDLSGTTPEWRNGPRTWGQLHAGLVLTPAGVLAATITGEYSHALLEAIDPAAAQSQVVAFAERPLAVALRESERFELRTDYQGRRRLDIEENGMTTSVDLGYAATELRALDDALLAYSLDRYDPCYPRLSPPDDEFGCSPDDRPALSLLKTTPPTLESEAPLPMTDPSSVGDISQDWREILTQGQQVALLQRRSARCSNERNCTALGVAFDVVEGFGDFEQHWLFPFDRTTATFETPLLLPDEPGFTGLSASGLSTRDATALVLSTPLSHDEDQVLLAHIELLRIPETTLSGLDRAERITVPGEPMFVAGERAVSIEPAGPVADTSVDVRVHSLRLSEGIAYIEQTLDLPAGHAAHAWAEQRGYVLLVPDDRCADPNSKVIAVSVANGVLSVSGDIQLPGTQWRLARVSDDLALLTRTIGELEQHAVIDATSVGLSLRGYETHPRGTPVDVFEGQVSFANRASP